MLLTQGEPLAKSWMLAFITQAAKSEKKKKLRYGLIKKYGVRSSSLRSPGIRGKQGHHLDHRSEGSSQRLSKALGNVLSSMYTEDPRAQKHEAVCPTSLKLLRALMGT